jgi:hypothetical protein
MDIFEPSYPHRIIGKTIAYYAGREVQRIADIRTYVNRCLNGDVPHPFWIVCRP